jgi:hypothetical protein
LIIATELHIVNHSPLHLRNMRFQDGATGVSPVQPGGDARLSTRNIAVWLALPLLKIPMTFYTGSFPPHTRLAFGKTSARRVHAP